jgi:glycosyltransferase involved in cell wall biosynthesis
VVYSGIEAADFPVPAPDSPVEDRLWRGRLVYVGRVDRRKGIETAIAALARLDGIGLRVIGQGEEPFLNEMRRLAFELGVAERVVFTSAPRSQLRGEYRAADVCVFPSTWAEPFGLVPLEAMASDTPVVATGTGGSGEFLEHERNCLLYPPGDDEALANAVSRLAGDPALRASLVRAGRATAGALTSDALADALEEWHVAAVEGYRGGTPADRRLPGRIA